MRGYRLGKALYPLLVLLLVLLISPAPVGAATPQVSIPDARIKPGDTTTLPIQISGVNNLGTATIWLSYHKEVVRVEQVANGDMGSVIYAVYPDAGVTKMTWFNAYGVSGDKVLAYVTLHAVGTSGTTSPLDLDVKEFVDTSFNSIIPLVTDATFTIAGVSPAPVAVQEAPEIIIMSTVSTTGLTATPSLKMDSNGIVQEACQLKSLDKKVTLNIDGRTKLLNSQGHAVASLSADVVTSPPAPPAERAIISAYDLGPNGATFEPAITLTISYDPKALSEGATENELYIAYWNGLQWLTLESTVDTEANTVSAKISHFTQFTVIGKLPLLAPASTPPAPPTPPVPALAAFAVSDLSIAPREVKPAERVTIWAVVTNNGSSEGSHTVVLKINGVEEASKVVTIGPGERETVSFIVAKDAEGPYSVSIDSEAGQFTVTDAPAPVTPPTKPISWTLVWSIISGVVVVGLVLRLVVFRRRAQQA